MVNKDNFLSLDSVSQFYVAAGIFGIAFIGLRDIVVRDQIQIAHIWVLLAVYVWFMCSVSFFSGRLSSRNETLLFYLQSVQAVVTSPQDSLDFLYLDTELVTFFYHNLYLANYNRAKFSDSVVKSDKLLYYMYLLRTQKVPRKGSRARRLLSVAKTCATNAMNDFHSIIFSLPKTKQVTEEFTGPVLARLFAILTKIISIIGRYTEDDKYRANIARPTQKSGETTSQFDLYIF